MINYPRPTTATDIKRFLGLCSWYRRFINNFSTLVSPLNDLLKGKKKKENIVWSQEAEEAFIQIKNSLVQSPVLSSPDFSKPFTIQCDASNTGLGGILTQEMGGHERVIAYASRSLSRAERNYSVTERELLSLIFLIEKFRPYIEGTEFNVITDHHSLLWLNNLKDPTGRLARWSVRLRQYSFNLIHKKGSSNVVPDALSRIPPCSPETMAKVSLIDVSLNNAGKWYTSLRENVINTPDSYPQWKVEDDHLYKYVPSRVPLQTTVSEWKLLVPKPQRRAVIKSSHDPPTTAHLGFFKTLSRIQESYYWPQMRHDILGYVRSCKVCQSQKVSNAARFGLMGKEKQVKYPFQVIAADIMGPFPRSSKGNTHLLVVADWFSKYSLLCPMRDATAQNVIRFIENQVFLVHGVPQFIVCDNGTQFAGKAFKKLAESYNVQKIWYSPRYAAQCNFVERTNRTIGTAIRSFISEHKDWDKELPKIQQALNTAVHEVYGLPPSLVNFGRHIPLSGDYYGKVKDTSEVELMPGNRDDFVEELSKGLSETFKDIRKKLHLAYKRNASSYNVRKRDVSFSVGDRVWRRNKVLSDASAKFSAKLAPRYVLCRIEKKISRIVYSLTNLDGTPAGEWHVKDLKPHFGSNSDVSVN